jgi:hypothetical protein
MINPNTHIPISKLLNRIERFYIDKKIKTFKPVKATGIDRFIIKNGIGVGILDLGGIVYCEVLEGYMKEGFLLCGAIFLENVSSF